jgi:hypothetical protein
LATADLAIAKDTAGFIEAHDIALNNYDFNTIVAGHLTRLGTRADVEVQKEFVLDLERAAARANQNVSFMDIATRVGFDNPWLLFSEYFNAINKQCEGEMLQKWESRLGGTQAFMSTHCIAMTQSGRVDPTVQALFQSIGLASIGVITRYNWSGYCYLRLGQAPGVFQRLRDKPFWLVDGVCLIMGECYTKRYWNLAILTVLLHYI